MITIGNEKRQFDLGHPVVGFSEETRFTQPGIFPDWSGFNFSIPGFHFLSIVFAIFS